MQQQNAASAVGMTSLMGVRRVRMGVSSFVARLAPRVAHALVACMRVFGAARTRSCSVLHVDLVLHVDVEFRLGGDSWLRVCLAGCDVLKRQEEPPASDQLLASF